MAADLFYVLGTWTRVWWQAAPKELCESSLKSLWKKTTSNKKQNKKCIKKDIGNIDNALKPHSFGTKNNMGIGHGYFDNSKRNMLSLKWISANELKGV